jgi:hypothetical protein
MAVAKRLADVSDRFFFWRSVEDLRDTMNLKANMSLSTLSDVLSLRMHRTVAGQIKRNIADPRVRQMLEHFIQYVGSSPSPLRPCSAGSRRCSSARACGIPSGGRAPCPWR